LGYSFFLAAATPFLPFLPIVDLGFVVYTPECGDAMRAWSSLASFSFCSSFTAASITYCSFSRFLATLAAIYLRLSLVIL
jgi:hypothetical protein